MSVYFDYKVNLCSTYEAVTVVWHSQLPLLGVGVNVEESNGGSVYICDELVG
jgi:hypothetical protein